MTSRTTLPNEGVLARSGAWGDQGNYAFTALAQRWQTLQTDPLVPITPPYNRMPQLTFTAFRQEVLGGDFDLFSSYVRFRSPDARERQARARLPELRAAAAERRTPT